MMPKLQLKIKNYTNKKIWNLLLLFILGQILLASCSPREQREYEAGVSYVKEKKFKEAQASFLNSVLLVPSSESALAAAKEGARVSLYELRDYPKAIQFYKSLVFYSKDPEERVQAQKQIINIYFENLNDYKSAIQEANLLVTTVTGTEDIADLKIILAKSYYYLNDFAQAENEIDEFIRAFPKDQRHFDLMLLKGNINLAQKNLAKAVVSLRALIEKFPEQSKKANVALILAVCYEEMKDYKNAKLTLEEMKKYHPMPDYINLRIKRLDEIQKNQPGARGFHK